MQPTYIPETVDSSVSSYFMNTKMEGNVINVDIGFSHANAVIRQLIISQPRL